MMGETSRFCFGLGDPDGFAAARRGPLGAARRGEHAADAVRRARRAARRRTGAALYAIHCTEDSPLFYAVWYGLAILVATAIGAALGRFLLRW